METEVNKYRGFSIVFNTDEETFSAWSDRYDTEFAKKSYAAVIRGVDEYIKMNAEFNEFSVRRSLSYSGKIEEMGDPIRIIGIRKDGKPVYKGPEGENKSITKHDINKYIIDEPGFAEIKNEYDLEKAAFKALEKSHREAVSKILAKANDYTSLKDYLSELP